MSPRWNIHIFIFDTKLRFCLSVKYLRIRRDVDRHDSGIAARLGGGAPLAHWRSNVFNSETACLVFENGNCLFSPPHHLIRVNRTIVIFVFARMEKNSWKRFPDVYVAKRKKCRKKDFGKWIGKNVGTNACRERGECFWIWDRRRFRR